MNREINNEQWLYIDRAKDAFNELDISLNTVEGYNEENFKNKLDALRTRLDLLEQVLSD